ncbi:EP300-interacting inhibitor of differentiation 3-like [Melanaphis sacchari]|uniref:EP300-interacting inhibitor of differentiation 3-like n=1 Tax=Melanaphis sacchari TaxID=742174 RepID=UPI000DC1508F|nr:EP300-interacting inhibitor of differentiation 3-like [Melanaphis sacchari]XP_025209002.1 EP300-interacting inhibitor of differentiation 3-like [Melanaphis sacchari]
MSSFSSSVNESSSEEEFQLFKTQLKKVQDFIEECNNKIVNKTLCANDLSLMKIEMKYLTELEQQVTSEKMKSSYVLYKTLSLKMVQESYRICSWLIEKQCSEMDNMFDIDTYVIKIIEACDDKEDPLSHIDTIFNGAFKNINCFNLNFYGNIKSEESAETQVITQSRKEYRKSQKRPLEDQVVPVEVGSDTGDNELQITLSKVKHCLKKALINNQGNPISFYAFAIDPFSLTFTIENLFHLATLVKDHFVEIKRISDGENYEFSTITLAKKRNTNDKPKTDDNISSLFTMNYELWQYYVKKFHITERMIKQDGDD